MTKRSFYATGHLAQFALRLNRLHLTVWLLSLVAVTLSVVAAFSPLYPTQVERQAIAETLRNPAMVAMLGPAYGIDNYTIGAMTAHQMMLFTALAVAIMNVLFVIRTTRSDEEKGRIELIRSLPVGRQAPLAATFAVVVVVNAVLAVTTGLGLIALRIESVDMAGSMLYGAALGATGLTFAAITALFAQLNETARGTLGWSFAFMGLAYLLRAVGDIYAELLSLLSPFGLILRTQVYVNNYWWPVAVALAVSAAITGLAFYVHSRRDLQAGLIAARPGKRHAAKTLNNPLGLAWRLQRPTIIGWAVGMFVLGASYGSVFNELDDFLASDTLQKLLAPTAGVSLADQFTAMVIVVMAMIGAVPAIMMITKLNNEENAHRTEQLLALPVSRRALIASYIVLATVTALAMPLLAGLGLSTAASAVMDEPIRLGTVIGASLAYVPAVLAIVGLTALTVGFVPRATGFIWLYLSFSFFVVYIGDLLQLPAWLGRLSPFGHIPQSPVETMQTWPVIGVLAIGLAAVVVGVKGYIQRDING